MYRVIPFPFFHNNSFIFIQPNIEYLVVDYNKEHYYNINLHEFSNCVAENSLLFLRRILHSIYTVNANAKNCELSLLRRKNILQPTRNVKQAKLNIMWIQLSQLNNWLFSTQKSLLIDYICSDEISSHPISGVGIIEISGSCYVKTPYLTIHGLNEKMTKINNFYLPPLNISHVFKTTTFKIHNETGEEVFIQYSAQEDLAKLSDQIKIEKEQENIELKHVDIHTVHHYTVLYIIVFVILSYTLYKIIIKYQIRCKKSNTEADQDEEQSHDQDSNDKPFVLTLRK